MNLVVFWGRYIYKSYGVPNEFGEYATGNVDSHYRRLVLAVHQIHPVRVVLVNFISQGVNTMEQPVRRAYTYSYDIVRLSFCTIFEAFPAVIVTFVVSGARVGCAS